MQAMHVPDILDLHNSQSILSNYDVIMWTFIQKVLFFLTEHDIHCIITAQYCVYICVGARTCMHAEVSHHAPPVMHRIATRQAWHGLTVRDIFHIFLKFDSIRFITAFCWHHKQTRPYTSFTLHLWALRAKASMWVRLDECTTRYAIASRLNIYWWIFMGNTPKDSWFQQLSFEVSILKIRL